jgi:predicted dehydrogenase
MFRWGVLSTAKIGRDLVIPAIVEAENGVLSAIASRDIKKGRALAKRFGALHAFGSYEELLASDTVDGVYIPLPTSQHVEWAAKAAEAGKHVLVEKPLALDAKDIAPLIKLRNRKKVLISEAFMVTYHPQWLKVRELVRSGAIGRLRHVQGAFTYFNVDPKNMRNQLSLGGGALPDIGVYPTVSTRFVTGKEPKRVQATIERDKKFHGDKGFIEIHSPFNAGLYDHHRIELHNQSHTEATVFRFPGTQQYRLEVEIFARAAQGGKEELFTLESSVLNQKVIDAIFRAGDKDGSWEKV